MDDWQQKQAKFDQLPIDVETINLTISHLNQTMGKVNENLASIEADINVMVMLLSRVEQSVQQQTKALENVKDLLVLEATERSKEG